MSPVTISRRVRGITLIEVLVAVIILTIGLVGLVALQARAAQVSANADDTNRAAMLAAEAASLMWIARSASLPAAAVSDWQDRVASSPGVGLPNGNGTIAVASGVATITVSWRPPQAASGAQDNRYVTQVVVP